MIAPLPIIPRASTAIGSVMGCDSGLENIFELRGRRVFQQLGSLENLSLACLGCLGGQPLQWTDGPVVFEGPE